MWVLCGKVNSIDMCQ